MSQLGGIASFDISATQVALMFSPFILLLLSLVIALTMRSGKYSVTLLCCFALGLTLVFTYGEPWRLPSKMMDQPFVQAWYGTAWLDLILLPLLVWLYCKRSGLLVKKLPNTR